MKIRYLGHSCFTITSDCGVTVLTDPYTKVGYEMPVGTTAEIVTVSHGHFDHAYIQGVNGNPIIVTQSVMIGDIKVMAIPTWHDPKNGQLRGSNNVYLIEIDGMKICHMGDLGEIGNAALIESVKECDILMIPIGGTYTIDAEQAKQYMEAICPKIVIPMHYKPSDGALDIDTEHAFLRLFSEKEILRKRGEVDLDIKACGEPGKRIIFMERI